MPKRGRRNPFSQEPLPDDLKPAAVNEWVPVWRRVIAEPSVKNVGLHAASYADPDGTNIFPGILRMANVTGLSERAVRDAFSFIRESGLMHRCSKGSAAGRRGFSDEYRLTIPLDIFARVQMLTPEEEYPDEDRPVLFTIGLEGTAALAAGDPCG
ncbi:MAG: hypothetical protein ACRDOL_22610 [Streptosporangiaceae bacterium]